MRPRRSGSGKLRGPMRRWFLLAVFLPALAFPGCKRSGSARLEGRWRGVRAEGVTADVQAAANGFATQLEIEAKGEFITVATAKETQSGRYTVVREDKTQIVIVTDKDGEKEPQTFLVVDDRTLRWNLSDGRAIVLARTP